ncbi:403_t:CDS:2, partial [Cetraspora pellucida]
VRRLVQAGTSGLTRTGPLVQCLYPLLYIVIVEHFIIILCFVKNWTAPLKNYKKDCARIKVDLMKVKQVNQLSTGDGATYNDNRQRKHHRDVDDDEKNKCKTKSEKRTRSGIVTVPNYHGLLTTYTDENPFQENEEEATTEDSFENRSQENDEKRNIQDNIVSSYLIIRPQGKLPAHCEHHLPIFFIR